MEAPVHPGVPFHLGQVRMVAWDGILEGVCLHAALIEWSRHSTAGATGRAVDAGNWLSAIVSWHACFILLGTRLLWPELLLLLLLLHCLSGGRHGATSRSNLCTAWQWPCPPTKAACSTTVRADTY